MAEESRRIFENADCHLLWGDDGRPEVVITYPDDAMKGCIRRLGESPDNQARQIGSGNVPCLHVPVHVFRKLQYLPPSLVEDALQVMSPSKVPEGLSDAKQREYAQEVMKNAVATLTHGLLPDIRHMEAGRDNSYYLPPSAAFLSSKATELALNVAGWFATHAGGEGAISWDFTSGKAGIYVNPVKENNNEVVMGRIRTLLAQRDVQVAPSKIVQKGQHKFEYLFFGNNPDPRFLQWVQRDLAGKGVENTVHTSAAFDGQVISIPLSLTAESVKNYRNWRRGPFSPIAGTLAQEAQWLQALLPQVSAKEVPGSEELRDSNGNILIVEKNTVELNVPEVLMDTLAGYLRRQGIECDMQRGEKANQSMVVVHDAATFKRLERHLGTDVQRQREQGSNRSLWPEGRSPGRGRGGDTGRPR